MSSMTQSAAEPVSSALLQIAEHMTSARDDRHAERLREVSGKLTDEQLIVAFCGHFSAGKSTLINRLCGAQLLPSSPIPTSANVVSIADGEPCARIERQSGGKRTYIEAPPEELEAYCVNGEDFTSVAITYPIPRLGGHTVLLDTPGIDSTDDAHRMATESALHLADVVFYVMDYNHVQSEINFAFAKQLKDWGKPLYLIVNQIDKHRDQELPFAEYKRSVEEAFAGWHLEPAGILYLSMREPDHPHQQWDTLTELLTELAAIRQPLSRVSVEASARHLLVEHERWLSEQREPEREGLMAQAGGEAGLAEVRGELESLAALERARQEAPDRLRVSLRQDVQSLLDNANIMPAATRDLAHAFLESRRPGFRMGLLFAGAKTAAEQERRLEQFYTELQSGIRSGIEWHLMDLFRKEAAKLGWQEEALEERLAAELTGLVEPEMLEAEIKPGAAFSNEATMNYCQSLAGSIKGRYRKHAADWTDELAQLAARLADQQAAEQSGRREELAQQAEAVTRLEAIDREAAAYTRTLAELLPSAQAVPKLPVPRITPPAEGAQQAVSAEQAPETSSGSQLVMPLAGSAGAGLAKAAATEAGASGALASATVLAPQRMAAERLRRAADLLDPTAALASAATAMRSKADRLQRNRFTIALFGAFSAGKSSFANALIGEPVLPVSPNPTTAAINRIVPPSADHPHGSARIIMKSEAAMLDDLQFSMKLLGEEVEGLSASQLMEKIGQLTPDALHPGGRPHYSFLKAAAKGWEELQEHLDGELLVDTAGYRQYVAEEWRSCFVREIELFYDCPLTAQGIVLVDTPGADSVNARHTGVAFNYIKNADAILFVTYYNHAFSQADRQFLLQLGRVKDQFELDKMFFIVNAADLAADEAELNGVVEHVERNLLQHGIRFPRLHPLASLAALDAKQRGDEAAMAASGIQAFEDAFLRFTSTELGQLAVDSATEEIARSAKTIGSWLQAARGDELSRQAQREQLTVRIDEALQTASGFRGRLSFEPIRQELQELLHYVLQRVQFRFGEHYNLAFNPSTLQEDGRDLRKMLWTSWLELQRLLQSELSEELLATTLRMEGALKRQVAAQYAAVAEDLGVRLDSFTAAAYEPPELAQPDMLAPWQTETVDRKLLWSRFKSARHFFEGEGKGQLRQELEHLLSTPLQHYADATAEAWLAHYESQWRQLVEITETKLQSEIRTYGDSTMASLTEHTDPAELERLLAQIEAIVAESRPQAV
ncbi:dynamin family protein [Paenibacillus daejeonensis]|uniref:dynamin family protein n=1 Tax=Paenibacillus daejeonensis TaxID=135193 RepID=UPI00037BDC54|nr:dynamin family protein [Paenibacillus daejeonensis]